MKVSCTSLVNLLLLAPMLLVSNILFAQSGEYEDEDLNPKYKWELGVNLGASAFLGDLGGRIGVGKDFAKDYIFKTARPFVGLSINYYPTRWFNIIAGVNYTKLVGADSLVKNEKGAERWRYNRNLSFKSTIWEGYLGTEILLLPAVSESFANGRLTPYIGAGIGVFHFNPKTEYKGKWVDLKPLRLEGEGFKEYPDRHIYSLTQFYVPLTLGLKYVINPDYSLSGGITFRYTYTDYIDDVATTYIDPALFDKYLPSAEAAMAKDLYARSKTPWKVKPGVDRADRDGNKNDSYTSVFLTLRIVLRKRSSYYIGYW